MLPRRGGKKDVGWNAGEGRREKICGGKVGKGAQVMESAVCGERERGSSGPGDGKEGGQLGPAGRLARATLIEQRSQCVRANRARLGSGEADEGR